MVDGALSAVAEAIDSAGGGAGSPGDHPAMAMALIKARSR